MDRSAQPLSRARPGTAPVKPFSGWPRDHILQAALYSETVHRFMDATAPQSCTTCSWSPVLCRTVWLSPLMVHAVPPKKTWVRVRVRG